MPQDRAVVVRPLIWLLAIALAGVLGIAGPVGAVSSSRDTAPRDTAHSTPTYRVAPPDLGPRKATARRAPSTRASHSALLAGTGHITGAVTGDAGQPLEDVWVEAYLWNNDEEWWEDVRGRYTGVDGAYDLNGLAAGSYRIAFEPDSVPGSYESEYWDDAASFEDATLIDLAAGQTVAGTDAELAVQGRITGTVTGPAGEPLAGIEVTAYQLEAEEDEDYWYESAAASTDSDGSYDLGALDTGTYRVEFVDHDTGHVAEYWHDTATWADATAIQVSAGTVTSAIDAQLAVGGVIDGVVTAPDGHTLADIEVRAYRWDEATGTWEWAYYTYTNANGFYDMSGLPDGSYRLGFFHLDDYYVAEYWDDATTLAGATTIEVTAGQPRHGRDARLAELGSIAGTVTDSTGAPLWDVQVLAYLWSDDDDLWEPYDEAYTVEDGSYRMGGLEPGTYRLRFWGDDNTLKEYWDDAATLGSATDLDLALDQTISGADAQLAPLATPVVINTSLPTISGLPQVGSTLTAINGMWTPASGLAFSHQWFVGGKPVPGATSPTYVPTAADTGKTIQVQVRATRSGYTSRTASSSATVAVAADPVPVNTTQPGVSGSPRVGSIVTATPGVWTEAGATFGYQWLVGGKPVLGATRAAYTPVAPDAGKQLQVRVTATVAGHTSDAATSTPVAVGKGTLKATKKPKVTGKAKKNATLKVSPGTWSAKAKVTYRWYAGAKAIPKATGAKLKLAGKTLKTVKGKAISVILTITAPGYSALTTKLKVPGKVKLR